MLNKANFIVFVFLNFIIFLPSLEDIFSLFLEEEDGREDLERGLGERKRGRETGMREKNVDQWTLTRAATRTGTATQACALT